MRKTAKTSTLNADRAKRKAHKARCIKTIPQRQVQGGLILDLQFHIHNQILGRIDHNKVVANTNRYHFIVAKFTDDWDGAAIDCIGYSSSGEPITFNVDDARDNVWVVPPELIQPPAFNVSFVGVKEDGERITTGIVRVDVAKSGYLSGAMPEDTYPTKYEALMSELAEIRREADEAVLRVQTAVAGDVINDGLIGEKTTYSSKKIEDRFMDGAEVDAAIAEGTKGLQGVEYSTPEDIDKYTF